MMKPRRTAPKVTTKLLIAQIDAHLRKVTGNEAKTAVLTAARDALQNPSAITSLHETIKRNPGYKKILDIDMTQKIIDAVVRSALKKRPNKQEEQLIQQDIRARKGQLAQLIEERDFGKTSPQRVQKLNQRIFLLEGRIAAEEKKLPEQLEREHQKLFKQVEKQFAAMISKSDTKHDHKYEMMKLAMQCLKGNITPEQLEQAKEKYPDYNKAFFSSRTEKLVEETLLTLRNPVVKQNIELSAPQEKTEQQEDEATYTSGDSNRFS